MAMTREQARAIVADLLQKNPRLRGQNMDSLIARVMVNEGMMSPEEAIQPQTGAKAPAIMQAILAAQQSPPPVTPASPAPMRPGVPVMAPRPEATQLPRVPQPEVPAVGGPLERPAVTPDMVRSAPQGQVEQGTEEKKGGYQSPFRLAAKAAEEDLKALSKEYDDLKAEGKELTPESKLKLKMATDKFIALQTRAIADEAVQMDPERAAILARQTARLEGEEKRVKQEEKEAPWDAALRASLALMSPRKGANFLGALGEGLGAGLETYEAAKAKATEARARLGERADQIAANRIDIMDKARAAAREAIAAGEQVDERTLRIANLTDEAIVNEATRGFRISAAESAASKAATEARYAPAMAESEIGLRGAQAKYYNDGRGGADGVSATTLFNASEDAKNKAIEYQGKVRDKFQAWRESDKGINFERSGPEWDAYMAELRTYKYLRKRAGLEGVLPDLSPKYINKPNPAPKAAPAPRAPAAGRILSSTPIK